MVQASMLGVVWFFFFNNNLPENSTYRLSNIIKLPITVLFLKLNNLIFINLFSLVLFQNLWSFVLLSWTLPEFF